MNHPIAEAARKPLVLASAMLLMVASLLLPLGVQAQPADPGHIPASTPARSLNDQLKVNPELNTLRKVSPRLLTQKGPAQVVLELQAAPTTQVYAQALTGGQSARAVTTAQAQLAQINAAQQRVLSSLGGVGATVLYRTQRVYNGIAVMVDSSRLTDLARLPDVKAIHPLVAKHIDNASSVPLIGAPQLWAGAAGLTGQGIKVGIIDTGIDYIHTDFGGAGTGYDANNPAVVEAGSFPTAKVVGGHDFVGNDYNADPSSPAFQPVPHPDDDPLDCNGHGSHVAGTAAGFGVNTNGSTYTGPYNSAIDFSGFRIGPGVAPQASLYALKVFGCDGSTNVVAEAIEWAVDPNGDGDFSDHLDVINMSLGQDFGVPGDPDVAASDNAATAGVVVVASAGNASDTYFIAGSPALSARTISVASSRDSTAVVDAFRVNTPPAIAGLHPALFSARYDWENSTPVTGTLVYIADQNTGCQTYTPANAAQISGKVLLIDWTDDECGSITRTANAVKAGAIGVILADNSDAFDLNISGSDVVPSVSTPKEVGAQLKANIASGVSVTFSNDLHNASKIVDPTLTDTLSDFSSRGPRRDNLALKPDITAPGETIFSVANGTGNQGVTENGTSMASPHVAGSMALLKQLHPTWTVEELKALAMNTATNDIRSEQAAGSPLYSPSRVGAGRIDLPNAAASTVVAYDAGGPGEVSVSYGEVEVITTTTEVRHITVLNKGNTGETYNVAYLPRTEVPGVSFSVSPSSVTIPALGEATVTVTMTANAAQMKHNHDETVAETQAGLPRHWLSEAQGLVTFSKSGPALLRVPVYAAPRPVSNMHAGTESLALSGTVLTATIPLTGTGVNTGDKYPVDEVSLATAFELQYTSPQDPSLGSVNAKADLRYIGVSSDFRSTQTITNPTGVLSNTTAYFGIATYGDWATPNEVEFDIYIDTNRDGTPDYVVFNTNAASTDPTDVFVTELCPLTGNGGCSLLDYVNGVPADELDTRVFNTNVMALPVPLSELGLTGTDGTFDYSIVTYSRFDLHDPDYNSVMADMSPTLTYNAAKPGIDLTGGMAGTPAYFDLPGKSIPVRFDPFAYLDNRSEGVLLLHHFNPSDTRAEVVTLAGGPSRAYLPLIGQR